MSASGEEGHDIGHPGAEVTWRAGPAGCQPCASAALAGTSASPGLFYGELRMAFPTLK